MNQPAADPAWERLAFADLHVNAATLDRSVAVLRKIGEVAAAREVPIVFTGDFWDKRGILATRQIDAVLGELDTWQRNGVFGIFIPGNHDQVALSGKVHAMRIFDPFPNVLVVTERILDAQDRIAYIPWREDVQDQGMQFCLDAPGDWTVFGHVEVQGATANNGHAAAGRVTLAQIHGVARACYLGHYHKRQKIGDRTWYLGNPFQLDMGERGQPKGVAYITSDQVDPQFFDFDGFKSHHRIDLRGPVTMPAMKAIDTLEIVAEKAQLRDPDTIAWIDALPVDDIRQKPVAAAESEDAPPMAVSVEAAVTEHAGGPGGLAALGLALLGEVKHLSDVAEPLGTVARITAVKGRDFCALSGRFSVPLDQQGAVMIRGPQGSGKTALVDSVTWCLYGKTSPRRPGGEAASLRGDEVVNDHVDETSVTVNLDVDGEAYEVTRKRKRGKASRVRVRGPESRPEGIADEQEWVDRLVGLSYPLWRSCVSLGQGAVSNFLTSTDKGRKALLSDAHGLGVCIPARKLAKKKLSVVEGRISEANDRATGLRSVIEHMESQDFATEARTWADSRQGLATQLADTIDACDDAIIRADRGLAAAPDVDSQMSEAVEEVERLEKAATAGPTGDKKRSQLIKEIGGYEAERAIVERDFGVIQRNLAALISESSGKAHGTCPTCHQNWARAGLDTHVADSENALRSKSQEVETLTQRISNHEMTLAGLSGPSVESREKLLKALEAARERRAKVTQAQGAVEAIQRNRSTAEQKKAEAETQLAALEGEANPFLAREEAHERDLGTKRDDLENAEDDIRDEHEDAEALRFWVEGFGPNGLPVVVMRAVAGDLEATANGFLGQLTEGKIWAEMSLASDAIDIKFHKYDAEGKVWRERRYEQLSGGERRCAELAFSPLGLSEMLFRRLRCKVPLMVIDELTTHLGQHEKSIACNIIHDLDRETVVVIDHDPTVQGEFDVVYDLTGNNLTRTK